MLCKTFCLATGSYAQGFQIFLMRIAESFGSMVAVNIIVCAFDTHVKWWNDMVDGRNPAPVDTWFIPLFIRFQPSCWWFARFLWPIRRPVHLIPQCSPLSITARFVAWSETYPELLSTRWCSHQKDFLGWAVLQYLAFEGDIIMLSNWLERRAKKSPIITTWQWNISLEMVDVPAPNVWWQEGIQKWLVYVWP